MRGCLPWKKNPGRTWKVWAVRGSLWKSNHQRHSLQDLCQGLAKTKVLAFNLNGGFSRICQISMLQISISCLGDVMVSAQECHQRWGVCPHLTWQSVLKSGAGGIVIKFHRLHFPNLLFFIPHKSKPTVSIPALITHLTCTDPTANTGIIILFYGWRNWAWERLSGMAISEESTSSQKLSSQGWIPLILTLKSCLFSPVQGSHFAHVRKDCAYLVQHFSSLVVILDSGVTLILRGQSYPGHSKRLLVWKHIPGVRARRHSRHGSPWRFGCTQGMRFGRWPYITG